MAISVIILDNGHAKETKGKCSPDKLGFPILYEYEFNRDIVRRIYQNLSNVGVFCHILVPEEVTDVQLISKDPTSDTRVKRVNDLCKLHGASNCLLLSVHANAGGGTGNEFYTDTNTTKSDEYVKFVEEAFKKEFPDQVDRGHKQRDFTLINKTNCPAILGETGFMDTYSDKQLLSETKFRDRIAKSYSEAIIAIINSKI